MTNIKKLGLSALAGSLVAVSAQAGEMSVTGSANVTYKTGATANSNKSFGSDKDVAFTGSGELDNGWTFTVNTLLNDSYAVSSSYTSLTMGSLGTITAGQAWGGNSSGFDEEVPQAYEQTSDLTALGSSNLVGSFMDNGGLTWALPSFDLGGASASLVLGWSPNADDAATNNGGVGTRVDSAGVWGDGMDAGLTIASDMGVTVGVYAAQREQNSPVAAGGDANQDAFNGVWYAKYSAGPVSVGYSHSYLDSGVTGSAETATSTKAIRTAAGIFEETQMSISFNINDNVSISYTDSDDEYNAQDNASTAVANVSEETEAIQIAYSMGGMSIKAFQMELSNPDYDSNATKVTQTEIALGLAF